MEHFCKIDLKEWNRTTTKAQYKSISRLLRDYRNIIEPLAAAKFKQSMHDLCAYGISVIDN